MITIIFSGRLVIYLLCSLIKLKSPCACSGVLLVLNLDVVMCDPQGILDSIPSFPSSSLTASTRLKKFSSGCPAAITLSWLYKNPENWIVGLDFLARSAA